MRRVETPSHYNAPEFFLEPYWDGKRPFAVLSYQKDRVVGVMTGIHGDGQVTSGLLSRPQICLDKTADPMVAGGALVRGLLAEAGPAKLLTVYAWAGTPLDALRKHGFRTRKMEGDVVLDLKDGPELLFKKLDKKRRNNVRFAIKNGVEVFQASTEEDWSAYYEVYCQWRQTARKQIEGEQVSLPSYMRAMRLAANRRLFLARHSGKVVAGASLRFFRGGLIEYAGNSSRDEFLALKPNDLLVWKAIEWACQEGFTTISLGGAHKFLREFGGQVVPINRYRLDRTWLRRHDLRESTLDLGRSFLRKLPAPLEKNVRKILGKR